ncbi:hypothetical protein EZV62_025928 [Acer yangbiense]|uniref:F-box domain-containing protein n=1 Tax=Acer yangbiense TaxID=1000413 RepID=A0A5C7GZI6_9ROSI|nr:hypothetical protein EZV62_025928 [Acer yangbiense]
MANWAEFDPYLLAEISRHIPLHDDFIAFRGVCISWRSAATIKTTFMYKDSQMPWLMLLHLKSAPIYVISSVFPKAQEAKAAALSWQLINDE